MEPFAEDLSRSETASGYFSRDEMGSSEEGEPLSLLEEATPYDSEATLKIKRSYERGIPQRLLHAPLRLQSSLPYPQNIKPYWDRLTDYFEIYSSARIDSSSETSSLSELLDRLKRAQSVEQNTQKAAPEDIEYTLALSRIRELYYPGRDPGEIISYVDLLLLPYDISPEESTEAEQDAMLNNDPKFRDLMQLLDQERSNRNAAPFLEPSILFKELRRWKLLTELEVDPRQPILDLSLIHI